MLSKEMQEKLMGEIKRSDKFIELIGIKIIEADEGYCKAELKVDDCHLKPSWERCMAAACTHWRYSLLVLLRPSCGFEGPTLSGNMYFPQTDNGCEETDM